MGATDDQVVAGRKTGIAGDHVDEALRRSAGEVEGAGKHRGRTSEARSSSTGKGHHGSLSASARRWGTVVGFVDGRGGDEEERC